MKNDITNAFIKGVLSYLKDKGKSEDIADFLMQIKVEEPSVMHDYITELALASHPNEEEGVGCYSIQELEVAFDDYIQTGENKLYKELK